ncbi:hypothetical protein VNO80_20078 [Phaseolus coccineus]|uniref:Mechanosensitive ion channel MscS domain-containing protein n=1 Tax=Phaseolus coccineus TaxID=3886 RepID=A0AAN9MM45_PHACN
MWKWCVFILVILCGRLVTEWFINVLVFLIERNFLIKKKVLYFVYGVTKSVQGFIWLSLVLLTWDMLFSPGVKRTSKGARINLPSIHSQDSLAEKDEDENEQKDNEINSEWEAKAAAYRIFGNVAQPGHKYIEMDDLLRFMKNEVENVLPLFEGAVETRRIKRKSQELAGKVKVYLGRRSLIHSLNDTNTAVNELNILASAVVVIVIIIVWLLLTGFLTTKVLVFISSQLLLVVFMFGNTAKTVFETIIFVFIVHPFDVGDRCVIDGVQMVVEEMNILTTVFLRYDNEKNSYPNSVLATKPISNFNRSPEMSDSVEFAVDVSTSIESIGALKGKLKVYLESRPQHWHTKHMVLVKDIENVNKMKMAVNVTHTINFQNYGDKNSRRSELVMELKKILEHLNIKCYLLTREVHVCYVRRFGENSEVTTGIACLQGSLP